MNQTKIHTKHHLREMVLWSSLLLGLIIYSSILTKTTEGKLISPVRPTTPQPVQTSSPSPSPSATASPGATASPSATATPAATPSPIKITVKDNPQTTKLVIKFGETKDLTLLTDPSTSLAPDKLGLDYDKTKLEIVATATDTGAKLTVKGIGVAKEISLKASFNGAESTLLDKIDVRDVLTGLVILNKGNNTQKEVSKPDGAGLAKAQLTVLQRDKLDLALMGIFKSQTTQKLTWLTTPRLAPTANGILPSGGPGDLLIEGKDAGKSSADINPVTYDVKNSKPVDVFIEPAITTLEIDVSVRSADLFVELRTPSGDVLLPNGKVQIFGSILDANNIRTAGGITYSLGDTDDEIKKARTWVELSQDGINATLTWRTPSEQEIRDNYDLPSPKPLIGRPGNVKVKAVGQVSGNPFRPQSYATIRMAEVERFSQLKVKLNIMDERTAKDLYGTVTSNEYYVLMVRLFNDLKDDQTDQPTGKSIIAYSGSMEIAVGLEKKFLPDSKSSYPMTLTNKTVEEANKPPVPIPTPPSMDQEIQKAQADLTAAVDSATKALGDYNQKAAKYEENVNQANYDLLDQARLVANEALTRLESNWERVYNLRENAARWRYAMTARTRAEVGGTDTAFNDGLWHPVARPDFARLVPAVLGIPRFQSFSWSNKIGPIPKPDDLERMLREIPKLDGDSRDDPPCVGTITYRPLTFEMVVNTVDRRDERSTRSKVFKLLDAIGTGASFATAVAVPGSSSDLPLGLDKYRNLLIPGLDRLFPSKKEQNRQNIVAQTMKPIEEIPYGSDITRVIFIPKKPFRGLIRGHETRISEICPFFFKIEVAVIQNQATVQQGTSIP